MCNQYKTKFISPTVYHNTLREFTDINGILSPIFANNVLNDPFLVKHGDYNSGIVTNVLNMVDGTTTTNKVVGYFAAAKNTDLATSEYKFNIAMSFCVPEDYHRFSTRYARFLAMRKCLSGNGMMVHVDAPKRVIHSHSWPIYCFDKDNTICGQYITFNSRCINYYK